MIPLYDILEHIRKSKYIHKTRIAEHLRITPTQMLYISKTKNIHNTLLPKWCAFLEMDISDFTPLEQYDRREHIYRSLTDSVHCEALRLIIMDLIFFQTEIKVNVLNASVLPVTLPLVFLQPRDISNAIGELLNRKYST